MLDLHGPELACLALVVIGCIATLVLDEAGRVKLAGMAKVSASLGFVGLAYQTGVPGLPAGAVLTLALVLSAVGDAALIGKSRLAFVAGLGAFFLGHLAFAGAFWGRDIDASAAWITAGVILVPSLAFERWLAPLTGSLRPAVAAYIVVLGVMVSLAFGVGVHGDSPLLPVGAALFWLSDICVAWNRFVRPALSDVSQTRWAPWARRVGLPLYFGAQVLIILGFVLLAPRAA